MAVWHCEGNLLGGLGVCAGHTVYADSKGALDAWAIGKSIGHFTEYSYTRPDKGSINALAPGACHVALPYDQTTQIDYIMFRNNDIDSSRWYYGAVKHREYVNTNSTRLWFTLDYWLTFLDELRDGLGACLIERSHVKMADDWNGSTPSFKYLNPEPFVPRVIEKMYSEWNTAAEGIFIDLTPNTFVIYAASNENGDYTYELRSVAGVPTACYVKVCSSAVELMQTLKKFNDTFPILDDSGAETIIAVTYVPTELSQEGAGPVKFFNTTMPLKAETLRSDGNSVHNAKCLTYPYAFATAKAATGQQVVIKYEEFAQEGGTIEHYLQGGGGIESRYRYGVRQDKSDDRPNMKFINLPSYPQIPIRSDTFAQWAGSNGLAATVGAGIATAMIMTGIGSLAGLGGLSAVGTAGAQGAAATAALTNVTLGGSMLANQIGNLNQAYNAPDRMIGAASSAEAVAFNLYRVGFYRWQPTVEDLTAADDFFDAFGYNVNSYGVPNLKVRQYYTYVKTTNANCKAPVPHEGIEQICSMLNSGCTFWNITSGDIGVKRSENPDA